MDLKRTLFESGIKQTEIAKNFDVSKQLVWHWVNINLPTPWERLLKQYFAMRNVDIVEKKVKST